MTVRASMPWRLPVEAQSLAPPTGRWRPAFAPQRLAPETIARPRQPGRRRVRRVVLLPEQKRLAFRDTDGAVTFTVPRLDNFAMVALEYS